MMVTVRRAGAGMARYQLKDLHLVAAKAKAKVYRLADG